MARGLRETKHNIQQANEVLFERFLKERLDKAKYEEMQEGGVKGRQNDQSDQKGKMLARESAMQREYTRGGKSKDKKKKESRTERKQRSILSRAGRVAGFCTGEAIESDTSTQHSHNTSALILISVFLVRG